LTPHQDAQLLERMPQQWFGQLERRTDVVGAAVILDDLDLPAITGRVVRCACNVAE
jgi:hypothetical protein